MTQDARLGKGPGEEDHLTKWNKDAQFKFRERHWGCLSAKGYEGRYMTVT